MPILKAGTKLRSAVSSVEVILTRASGNEGDLYCGGVAMVDGPGTPEKVEGVEGSVLVGKRYVDSAGTIEVLCTKPGDGELTLNGETLTVRDAKPLPSSD